MYILNENCQSWSQSICVQNLIQINSVERISDNIECVSLVKMKASLNFNNFILNGNVVVLLFSFFREIVYL